MPKKKVRKNGLLVQECGDWRRSARFTPNYLYAPACLFLLGLLAGSPAPVQAEVTYTPPTTTVINTSVINDENQLNTSLDLWATLNNGAATSAIDGADDAVINVTNSGNDLFASVAANGSSLTTDLATVSGDAAGSALASVNAQLNTNVTAYAEVLNTTVTSTVTTPATGSSVTHSANSISATTSLNSTDQTVAGVLNTSFDSEHLGTATLTDAAPVLSADAGILVASAQLNDVVTDGVDTGFANIDGTDSISLTVAGALGDDLSLAADDNTISAAFTGNNADNVLAVQTGGATALTSSAGIVNLQSNYAVTSDTASAIVESGARISASVLADALVDSSLSFDDNTVSAAATGSVATNSLTVADGLSVDADGAQKNSLLFAGIEDNTTAGGLFLNNAQIASASAISALATDPVNAAALSVDSRGLIDSALSADDNVFEAIALGNDAASSLTVAGATSFESTVAAQNVQAAINSPISATAVNGTLSVMLGGSPALVDAPENDILGSTISVQDNTISATAVANRDPLLVSITGTTVTDGHSATADTTIDYSTTTMASTAGISAISAQGATDSDVIASNTGAGINMAAAGFNISTGAAGPHVSDSVFTVAGNTISSLANLNEGLVAVGVDANQLDASSAAASLQTATGSDATATTSGAITGGVNTRTAGGDTAASSVEIQVSGNTISATAGGNLNATALAADAATTMLVTDVIDEDGYPSVVLSLTAGTTNQALAEMAVLTDQRLSANAITATTTQDNINRIAGSIRLSGDPLTDSTLNVDDNQVTATARGNLTTNDLEFSALSVDMSAADATGGATGSNLAAMGAVQVIGQGSTVTATIAAGTNGNLQSSEIQGYQAGSGDLTNFELSVDGNAVVAAATGNTATSDLTGTGGALAADVAGDNAGELGMDLATVAVTTTDAAVANTVIQANAGTVAANLGLDNYYEITARTQANNTTTSYTKEITNSVVTADDNRAVALATGSSAEANTELTFTTLESSAATAVQQLQTGVTTATVGGTGGVTISAWTPINTDLFDSSLSASGNTVGAQAIGATATASLSAGGEDAVTLASGYSVDADGPSVIIDADTGATTLSADYMLGVQQVVSGATTATADDLSMLVAGGNFDGGSLSADGNFLTAQATGGNSSGALNLEANDMTAGGASANTVTGALATVQLLSDAVTSSLTASDVTATAVELTTAASTANGAEAVSVNDNTLLAAGMGLKSANTLITKAVTSVGGGAVEPIILTDLLAGGGDLALDSIDRTIASFQDVQANVTVTADTLAVAAAVTGSVANNIVGNIQGDSLSVDRNTLLAQGTGADSSNTLTTTAGASITGLTQAIVAGQDLDGAVTVSNTGSTATLTIDGTSLDSALSVSDNRLGATATGLKGANTMALSAPASLSDAIDTLYSHDIISIQLVNGPVTAGLAASGVNLTVDNSEDLAFTVDGSSLIADDNILEATAQGATNTNSLTASSGAITTVDFQIGSVQLSDAAVTANNFDTRIDLDVETDSANGSNLSVSGNTISATAGNLSGVNTMNIASLTANTGDTSVAELGTMTLLGGHAEADRTIASIQDVTGDGDVSATVAAANYDWMGMSIYVEDELEENSSATMTGNTIAAAATVAANTNSLTNTAKTELDASSLISAVQTSAADATASVEYAELGVYAGYYDDDDYEYFYSPIYDSTVDLSDNRMTATATGLTAFNTLAVEAGSMAGAMVELDAGGVDAVPMDQELYGFSVLASDQYTSGNISATIDTPYLSVDAEEFGYEDDGVENTATIHVDRNLVQAAATQAAAVNSLTQTAATAMVDAPALLAAAQEIVGGASADISDGWIGAWAEDDIAGSTVTVNDNRAVAMAMGGTLTNTLDVAAGSIAGDLDYGTLYAADADPWHEVYGSAALSSLQNISGDVSADVEYMEIIVESEDDDLWDSSTQLNSNQILASATAAAATNSLTQTAATAMVNAPALLAASQVVTSTDISASIDDSWIATWIEDDIGYSSIAQTGNLIQADVTGATLTNEMAVNANWIQGGDAFGSITSTTTVNPDHTMVGFSLLSSAQTVDTALSASVEYGGIEVDAEYDVWDSSIKLDDNRIQAFSTMASATNTLNQLADTSMADAPALLSASQILTGSSDAELSGDNYISINVEYDVEDSSLTVNNNTLQAVAMGGTMTNFLDPGAGTSMTAELLEEPDPRVNTTETRFDGTYAIASRQVSGATVSSLIADDPYIILDIDDGGAYSDSALIVSGNTIRSQATNLEAENTVITAATTDLTDVRTGVLSYQEVSGSTSAQIWNGHIYVYADDGDDGDEDSLEGSATVDRNLMAAVATGGSVTNSLDVSGLTISGAGVGVDSSLATSTLLAEAVSGDATQHSLLNLQTRDGEVLAAIDGDIDLSAEFDGYVTGSVSASDNLVAAQARGLVADNSLMVAADTIIDGGSSALGNVQTGDAAVTATISTNDNDFVDGYVYISTYEDLTGTATLDNNAVLASATANLADNSLKATAGTEMVNLGSETTALIDVPVESTTVGFALHNTQSLYSDGGVASTVEYFEIYTDAYDIEGAATVDNNSLVAQTRGNAAQNSLVLNAGTTLEASASLVNAQSNWGNTLSADVNSVAILLESGTVTGTTSVSGNTIQASTTANRALNSMDISGNLADSSGGSTGANTATADYTALNYQNNLGATVESTVSNASIALNNTATSGSAKVLNNAIVADATGNYANNTFTISAKGGTGTADFAFNGTQVNAGGTVSASITGASISLASGGAAGTFTTSGNSIGASASGNVSISTIKSTTGL